MALIGLIYDCYTPAVESQITRDLIALRDKYPRESFAVSAPSDDPEALVNALGVDLVRGGEPSMFVVYKTTEFWPEHPDENTCQVVTRDLYVSEESPSLSPAQPSVGYYRVPEQQGRPIRDQRPLYRPAPFGRGQVDPALLLIWGGPGLDF